MSAVLAPVRLGEVLGLARARNASDIHLSAGIPPALRVDGALQMQTTLVPAEDEIAAVAGSLLDDAALRTLEEVGDVTVSWNGDDFGRVRVHAYRSGRGTCLAIRLLALGVPSLESLQLPPIVATLVERSQGLIIFAGPTGSGKSTALAAVIDRINRTQTRHILAIEDPIEYRHESRQSIVTQRELGRDVSSYAQAVHGALRSDPDVLLVGEMRDPVTMHAVLTAAETGHLVFSTLHTGDATQTVDRIIGVFEGAKQEQMRYQLAQTLLAVVCMRLVPRAAGRGRRCAVEILLATDAVRNLIRDGKTHQLRNVISTGRHAGMQTLEAHLSDLIAAQEISIEAARLVTARSEELRFTGRTPSP